MILITGGRRPIPNSPNQVQQNVIVISTPGSLAGRHGVPNPVKPSSHLPRAKTKEFLTEIRFPRWQLNELPPQLFPSSLLLHIYHFLQGKRRRGIKIIIFLRRPAPGEVINSYPQTDVTN